MPTHTIKFNLPEESEDLRDAMQGTKMSIFINDVWDQLFRPHFKHGYNDKELQRLSATKDGAKVIELLSEKYNDLLQDSGIER